MEKVINSLMYQFNRWHKCTKATQKAFSAKVSQMYVASHEGRETKRQTTKMINNLRASFHNLLQNATWMDDGTVNIYNICVLYIFVCICTIHISY